MQKTTLKVTSPAPRNVWESLSKTDPEALPYQSAAWFDCVCKIGNYENVSRLYSAPDGRQFLMPLVRRRGLPDILTSAASLPSGWGMGGLLASDPILKKDMDAIFADLLRLPFLRTSVRPNPRRGELWAASKPEGMIAVPRVAHVLDLEGGFGKVWSERFKRKTRTAVRKAERLGVVVERDTTGRLVPVFYELLLRSFDRWAKQQNEPRFLTHLRGQRRDPLHKFQALAEQLGDTCHIWVAWVNGQPAATILVLQGGNVNDSRGAIDKAIAARTGANELIQKLAIEDACHAGCNYYHMGESGTSTSLAHYKERFGSLSYAYAEYYSERFPITMIDAGLRKVVKKVINFKD